MSPSRSGIKIPRLTSLPGFRAPKGMGLTEVTIRTRPRVGIGEATQIEPAGDPPPDWPGTRPEWAVYWGLNANGLKSPDDFTYQAKTPGVEKSYFSTLDFLIPSYHVGIEVQGEFWHYGLGSDKLQSDVLRKAYFAGQGIDVIFIREKHALADPKFYASEALRHRDHSEEF